MFVLLPQVVRSDRCHFTPPSSTVHAPLTHSTTLTNNRTDWINKVWPTEYTKWLTELHPQAHNFYPLVHLDSSQCHTPRLITSHHPLSHSVRFYCQANTPTALDACIKYSTALQPLLMPKALPLLRSLDVCNTRPFLSDQHDLSALQAPT
jgi:hypothetical protein